jgi:hypothetical protein
LFVAPALAAKAEIQLKCDVGWSIMYDALSFWLADQPAQSDWKVRVKGDATVVMDWAYNPAYHGLYCVRATVSDADNTGNHSVILSPRETIVIAAGGKYFFFVWARTTSNPHLGKLRLRYINSSGATTGDIKVYTFSGSGIGSWASGFVWGSAPGDAVSVQVEIELQSDGDWYFDALTLMEDRGLSELGVSGLEAPGDGVHAYIPDGVLSLLFRAEDVVSVGESAEVNGSATSYGTREGRETAESIRSYADAVRFAKSYFLNRAIVKHRPALTLSGLERRVLPGNYVRLVGDDGPALSGGFLLPVSRIRSSVSGEGLISQLLDIGERKADIPALLLQAARSEVLRVR